MNIQLGQFLQSILFNFTVLFSIHKYEHQHVKYPSFVPVIKPRITKYFLQKLELDESIFFQNGNASNYTIIGRDLKKKKKKEELFFLSGMHM